jgi:hypothetical protein
MFLEHGIQQCSFANNLRECTGRIEQDQGQQHAGKGTKARINFN